jgi:hypothetical protein
MTLRIDGIVEVVPPHEQDAQKQHQEAKENLMIAVAEREEEEKGGALRVLR